MRARMMDHMRSKMRRADIFQFIYAEMKREWDHALEDALDQMRDCIIDMCRFIREQLETATGDESKDASRTYPEDFRRVQLAMMTAKEKMQDLSGQMAGSTVEAIRLGYIAPRSSSEPQRT